MRHLYGLFLSLYFSVGVAATYQIPADSRVVGEMTVVTAKRGDTLNRIAVRNGVGYNEIIRANPKLSKRKLRASTQVVVPTAYVLPDTTYQGIVINLSAMRLYYFPDENTVMTYPVTIGKRGWSTPRAATTVVRKHRHPTWTPPKSIIREAARKGKKLRKVYPAGPNNPLGTRALRLGLAGYLIHGTNKPWTIGQRRSHGCIRMRRNDVEDLFDKVSVGTSVRIISQATPLAQLPNQVGQPEEEMFADTVSIQSRSKQYQRQVRQDTYNNYQSRSNRVMEIDASVMPLNDNASFVGQSISDEEQNNRELDNIFSQLSGNGAGYDDYQAGYPPIEGNTNFSKELGVE